MAVEYKVIRADTHEELESKLNELAPEQWTPQDYAIWSAGSMWAVHFVLLSRGAETANYQG